MYGFGRLQANGGRGTDRSRRATVYGGGSGGRIGLNITLFYSYKVCVCDGNRGLQKLQV